MDKPDFLKKTGDEERGNPLDVLREEPEDAGNLKPTEEELPQEETSPEEETKEEEVKTEEKTEEKEVQTEKKSEEEVKEPEKKEVQEEEKPKVDETELLKKHGLEKFKNLEDFFKSYKELQRKFTQITQQLPERLKQSRAQNELKYPLVRPQIPKIEDYYYEDEEGNTRVDFNAYMRDFTNSLIISLQQSLIQGPLAAKLFGVMSQAINERLNEELQQEEALRRGEAFLESVQEKYPILKKDEGLLEKLIAFVYGQAQLKGGLSFEEALSLADDFMAGRVEASKQEETKTETPPSTPQLSEKKKPTPEDDILKEVDEMFEFKKRSSIF